MLTIHYLLNGAIQTAQCDPPETTTTVPPDCVVEVLAEGQTIRHILENFANLPRPTVGAFRCRWYGDHARFIVGNLDCKS